MIDRLEGSVKGQENFFGITPEYHEMNWVGLDFTAQQFDTATSVTQAAWLKVLELRTA